MLSGCWVQRVCSAEGRLFINVQSASTPRLRCPKPATSLILPAPSAATSAGTFRGAKAQVKTCILAGSTPVQRGEAESVHGSMGISWAGRPWGTAIQAIPRHLPKHVYLLPVNICIRSNLLHTVPALVYRPDFGMCGPVHQNDAGGAAWLPPGP